MELLLLRGIIAGVVVAGVSALADRFPRAGALLLTLPLVSILAFVASWQKAQDLASVSRLARETLVLVPLAFAGRLGLGFWRAFGAGVLLASGAVLLWLWLGPQGL